MSILARIIRINPLKNNFFKDIRCLHTQHNPQQYVVSSSLNSWIWQQNNNVNLPQVIRQNIKLPSGMIWTPFIDKDESIAIDEPTNTEVDNTKQAARLIVIRRKKMKKHKLKKLRKKMKFEWAKLRQKRELRKEKEFQAELIKKCKVAESFDANEYVERKLAKYNEFKIPKLWKGRRYPEFIIREKMGLPPIK